MELNLSKEDAAFRDEVRAFIAENYPQEMRVPNPETDLTKEQSMLWHGILHKKGWIAPLWPKEYGGTGWSITQRFIWEQETSRAGVQRDHGWPRHLHLWQRRAEEEVLAENLVRR